MNHRLAPGFSGLSIKNFGAVLRCACYESPVEAETCAWIFVGRWESHQTKLAGLHIPDLRGTVLGRCDDKLPARIESQVCNRPLVLERLTHRQSGQRIPYSSRATLRASGQALSIRAHNKICKRSFRLD